MAGQLQAFVEAIDFPDDAKARVVVVVTDGTQKALRVIETDSIATLIFRARQTLLEIQSTSDLKSLRVGDVLDLSVPVVVLTPEEQAQADFLDAYGRLQSGLRKVAAGVIQSDDAELATLLATTQKAYRPEYVGLA